VGQHLTIFLLAIAVEGFDHSAGQKIQLDSLLDRPFPPAHNQVHNSKYSILNSLKLNEKNETNALFNEQYFQNSIKPNKFTQIPSFHD